MSTKSKTADIYHKLKTDIVDWRLAPGTPVTEPELARRLGASRTPVREALQRLHREGLVTMIPGQSATVSEVSVSGLLELFQIREALEGYTARLAARAAPDDRVENLRRELEHGRTYAASGDNDKFYMLCDALDTMVIELAANSLIAKSLGEIWDQVRRVRRLAAVNRERLLQSAQEHVDILNAIREGDEEAADASTRMHVRNSLRNILESLSGAGSDRP